LLRKSKLAVNEAREDRRLVELGSAGTSSRTDHKQLDRKDLDWLASLPPTLIYRDDVFLCHGSPESDTAYRLDGVTEDGKIQARPIEEIETQASGISASLIICGHTHLPRVVRLRNGRLVVNAGTSVVRDTTAQNQFITRCRQERLMLVTPQAAIVPMVEMKEASN
jgi:hypothetical protein